LGAYRIVLVAAGAMAPRAGRAARARFCRAKVTAGGALVGRRSPGQVLIVDDVAAAGGVRIGCAHPRAGDAPPGRGMPRPHGRRTETSRGAEVSRHFGMPVVASRIGDLLGCHRRAAVGIWRNRRIASNAGIGSRMADSHVLASRSWELPQAAPQGGP
jgi:hypothetical protein